MLVAYYLILSKHIEDGDKEDRWDWDPWTMTKFQSEEAAIEQAKRDYQDAWMDDWVRNTFVLEVVKVEPVITFDRKAKLELV